MDEINLWKIGSEQELAPLDSVAQLETELQLEDILVAHPELLDGGIELVGRQTPAAGGWLDLLAVDADGRLVIYELKRGMLGRDAVTQVLDYASALAEKEPGELAEHIGARSGEGGVQQIEDFAAWYEDRFGDLQRLLPARMVLVGLGVDETALRIARFIGEGPHDIEVITFHGFRDGEATLLARQLPVQRDVSTSPGAARQTIEQRRRLLDEHLDQSGVRGRFEAVRAALRERMPSGVFENPTAKGVSLQLSSIGPGGVRGPRHYFGVFAEYRSEGVVEISLGAITEQRHAEVHAALADRVALSEWLHGGKVIVIESDERWEQIKPYVCEFAEAVYEEWLRYRNEPPVE